MTPYSYDESDVRIRPSRRTRPRSKDRPSHDGAIYALVTTVDRGRTTCITDDAVIVNVQGDEPLIDPELINACAKRVNAHTPMATAAHTIHQIAEVFNPNVVKVVLDAKGDALMFSRAPLPWHRDGFVRDTQFMPPDYTPLRHIGIYGYRRDFLLHYPKLPVSPLETIEALEQLRVLWHGHRIAVHRVDEAPAAGVDTPEDLERVRRHFAV